MSRKNSREGKAARRAERETQARQVPGEPAQGAPEGLQDSLTALRDALARRADQADEFSRKGTRLLELLAASSGQGTIGEVLAGLPDDQRREAAGLIQFLEPRGGPSPRLTDPGEPRP